MTGYVLDEQDLEYIEKSVSGDPKIHCLIGKGVGNQYYSKADLTYLGIWTQDIYDVEHGFKDANGILKTFTDAEYTRRQTDYIWKATYRQSEDSKLLLRAADFVTLQPLHENSEYLSSQSIEVSADGKVAIELGAKRPKFLDSWEVLQGLSRGYVDRYLRDSHEPITQTAAFYPTDPAHTAPGAVLTFAVPAGVQDTGIRPRITLSLSLSPKATTALEYGRVAIQIVIGSSKPNVGSLVATTIGEAAGSSIPEMDITDYITANASNTIYVNVYMTQEFSTAHSAYTSHPGITASGTMNFYKRGELA